MSTERWICRLTGAASGLLLAIPHFWPLAAPLQLVALLPVLYLSARPRTTRRQILIAGGYMGILYVMPQAVLLRMPAWITAVLLLEMTILMTVFACCCRRFLAGSTVAGALAVGASLVVLDWVNITAVPIWSTAQSIVRPWSRYPSLISFVCVTGLTGIAFLLGTLQGLFINIMGCPKRRHCSICAAVLIVLVFGAANLIVRYPNTAGEIKVAAIGWTDGGSGDSADTSSPAGFDSLYAGPIAKAAEQGARLIVSPELGFYCGAGTREKWLERFRGVASRHNIFLAIGYFNGAHQENRLLFIGPDGQLLGEYAKTHLTPFEDFRKGDGEPVIINIDGIRVGAMICQDDNFTDISRRYGRKGVSMVVVPTLDWSTVKGAHLQSSIHRAIESRYAVVRAGINGISAIISPTGEVLEKMDHLEKGPGIIIADVPLYSGRTLFSIAGHWPVLPSVVFLLAYLTKGFYTARLRGKLDTERSGEDIEQGHKPPLEQNSEVRLAGPEGLCLV